MRLLSRSGDYLKHACVLPPHAQRGPIFAQHSLPLLLSGGELAAGAEDYCHLF